MFTRILVAFDGSVCAASALRKGAGLSALCGAELMILTVYRHHSLLEASLSMQRPATPENMDDVLSGHAKSIAQEGRRLALEAGAGAARAFIKAGQPARTIIAFGKEHHVDLIVVGSRGLGSVEEFLLGSVSHKLSGLADCPVLVV